jgi:hypothetical protein
MGLPDNDIPALRDVDDWNSANSSVGEDAVAGVGSIATYEGVYPSAPLCVSPPTLWRWLRVLHYHHAPAEAAFPAIPDIEISIHTQGRGHLARSAGGPWESRVVDRGHIAIAPANTADRRRWDTSLDAVHIYLSSARLRQLAESLRIDPQGAEILDRDVIRDPLIEQIGLVLLDELTARSGGGARLFQPESFHRPPPPQHRRDARQPSARGRAAAAIDRRKIATNGARF